MTTTAGAVDNRGLPAKALAFFLHEFRLVLPPTIFFALGFNLIVFTERLILAEYMIEFGGYLVAVMMALIVGKAVLVADKMPILRRFDHAPLIVPILYKTLVYWICVFIARLIEEMVSYTIDSGTIAGFVHHVAGEFSWNRFLFVQTWILVLFLLYTTAAEVADLLGDGELARIFFRYRPTELKRTRRERIRTLVRLSDLGRRYGAEELRDPASPAHREVMRLVTELARGKPGAA